LPYTVASPAQSIGRFAPSGKYGGYEVLDPRYQRMGSVEELLVNAGGEPVYVRVRVGLLGLRSVLVPAQSVLIDERRRILQLRHRSHGVRRIDN
jgi:hypothetical protein